MQDSLKLMWLLIFFASIVLLWYLERFLYFRTIFSICFVMIISQFKNAFKKQSRKLKYSTDIVVTIFITKSSLWKLQIVHFIFHICCLTLNINSTIDVSCMFFNNFIFRVLLSLHKFIDKSIPDGMLFEISYIFPIS